MKRLDEIGRTLRHAQATRRTETDSWLNGYQDDVSWLLEALRVANDLDAQHLAEAERLEEQLQTLQRERDEAVEDALRLGAFSGKDEAVAEVERLKEQFVAESHTAPFDVREFIAFAENLDPGVGPMFGRDASQLAHAYLRLEEQLALSDAEHDVDGVTIQRLEEQHEALLAEWRDYRATTDDVLKSMEEQLDESHALVADLKNALARERGGGSPLDRMSYLLLNDMARTFLASSPAISPRKGVHGEGTTAADRAKDTLPAKRPT